MTNDSVKIRWKHPNCNGDPINSYKIILHYMDKNTTITSTKDYVDIYTLNPDIIYKLAIISENNLGTSIPSIPFKFQLPNDLNSFGELYMWGTLNDEIPFDITEFDDFPEKPKRVNDFGNCLKSIEYQKVGAGILLDGTAFGFGHTIIENKKSTVTFDNPYEVNDNSKSIIPIVSKPYIMKFPFKQKIFITQISCGHEFMLALDVTGRVMGQGNNTYGELGRSDIIYASDPCIIEFPQSDRKSVV